MKDQSINDRRDVMEKRRSTMTYLMAFVIPMLVMVGIMIATGVEPFGDKSLVIIDGLHQYMPFFSVLQDKLQSGSSLFYSFRGGLGFNFWSLMAYYLSSPLNLIVVLFKKTQLNMVVSWLIACKIALTSLNASIYLNHRYFRPEKRRFREEESGKRAPQLLVLGLSLAFAFSGYVVGYCWNVMWLDAVMIFPLVMLGLERLVEKKDGRLYCLTLFYALWCNYYIAFMICIFAVIWFLLYSFKNIKSFFFGGLRFAFWSLVSGGLSAILLLPAYLGIKQTAAGDTMHLPSHEFLTGFGDLLKRQYALVAPITHDNFDGNANLYFGIFALVTIVLYLLNRRISLWDKFKKVLILAFLYISFNEKILNFIWHGFHDQYGIPNRFSFLFGFVILVMAFDAIRLQEGRRRWHVIAALILTMAGLAASIFLPEEPLEVYTYIIDGVLILLYSMLAWWACPAGKKAKNAPVEDSPIAEAEEVTHVRRRRAGKHAANKDLAKTAAVLLNICIIVEVLAAGVTGFFWNGQISVSKFFSDTDTIRTAAEDLKKENVGEFYRSELVKAKMLDENIWHPLNGVGLFGSTATDNMVKAMDGMGFYTGCNEYLYRGNCRLTNALFGVKYLYAREEDRKPTSFSFLKNKDGVDIYKNDTEDLSIGYMMDATILDWDSNNAYPFVVLNDLCECAFGEEEFLSEMPIDEPLTNGCNVTNTNNGEYRFEFEEQLDDNLTFVITPYETCDELLLYYDGTQVENTEVSVEGRIVAEGDIDGEIQTLGCVKAGENVIVKMKLKGEDTTGYVRLSAASVNEQRYQDFVREMIAGRLDAQIKNEDHIKGTVTAGEDQILFLSIPYDTAWQIKVDGEETEAEILGDAFLGIMLEPGKHEIEMQFLPQGFRIGAMISIGSLVLLILGWIFTVKRKKSEKEKKTEQEKESEKENKSEVCDEIINTAILEELPTDEPGEQVEEAYSENQ